MKQPTCGVCKTVCKTTSGLTRHISSTPLCRRAVAAKNRVRLDSVLAAAAPHPPQSDLDSDPSQDGDHMDIVYDPAAPEAAFDIDFDMHQSPETRSLSSSPTPPPPPPPPAPPINRQVYVEEIPDVDDSTYTEEFDGAAEVIARLVQSRIESDFASVCGRGEWGPFPSKVDWDFAKWAKTEAVSNGAVNRLLDIEGFNAQLRTKSMRDINRRVDALPSPASFQHTEISLMSGNCVFDLYWRDPLELVADLLADPSYADHMTWVPTHHYAGGREGSRLYNELPSGDWMYETQASQSSPHCPLVLILERKGAPPGRRHRSSDHYQL